MKTETEQVIRHIPIRELDLTSLARFSKEFPESEELEELGNSIKTNGIIEPIIVRKKGSRYEVIAGNRRVRAAKAVKLEIVPAIVRDLDDVHARRIAFIENMMRLKLEGIEAAKCLAAMYEDVGIRKEHAIQKMHRVINEEVRHGSMSVLQAHQSSSRELNALKKSAELTPKFLDVYKEIPVSANRQYTLLRLVTQLPEAIQTKAQESNLSTRKAELLAHKELKGHQEVQDWLVDEIKDKPLIVARAKVKQTEEDLKNGKMWVEKEGIGFGLGGKREEEPIDEELQIIMPDMLDAVLKAIGKLLHRPLTRGEILYESNIYKPKIIELQKQLKTIKKKDREWLASQAAILMQICKVIVDSAK